MWKVLLKIFICCVDTWSVTGCIGQTVYIYVYDLSGLVAYTVLACDWNSSCGDVFL